MRNGKQMDKITYPKQKNFKIEIGDIVERKLIEINRAVAAIFQDLNDENEERKNRELKIGILIPPPSFSLLNPM